VATIERFMPVPREAIWEALADPESYARWVVGVKAVRDADAGWPAPPGRLHHTTGIGPMTISDHTESLEARAPERLRLRSKVRPLATATVTFELHERDGGTLVRLSERPDGILAPLDWNPVFRALTRVRNAETLGRLERLALSRRSGGRARRRAAPRARSA
jgi:uncharacterized protein YndB with AHSA1/START domain